jgi:hypothetical protein
MMMVVVVVVVMLDICLYLARLLKQYAWLSRDCEDHQLEMLCHLFNGF